MRLLTSSISRTRHHDGRVFGNLSPRLPILLYAQSFQGSPPNSPGLAQPQSKARVNNGHRKIAGHKKWAAVLFAIRHWLPAFVECGLVMYKFYNVLSGIQKAFIRRGQTAPLRQIVILTAAFDGSAVDFRQILMVLLNPACSHHHKTKTKTGVKFNGVTLLFLSFDSYFPCRFGNLFHTSYKALCRFT